MPDDLAARLNAATARLIGRPVTPDERFGIAVSGGADSMALLAAAAACWPGQVAAATVDHGLRPDARAEAEMVGQWCARQGIAHAILDAQIDRTGNLQAEARAARYALLAHWQAGLGLDWLMTAHQADDQIETLILRLNRGAGVSGLSGIRARRGRLLRPLLGERRAALRAWCVARGVPFVDDPSNSDARFDRARLRAALAGAPWIDPAGLARSVEVLAQADAALAWATDELATEALELGEGNARLNRTDLPQDLLRRLLLRMIAHVNPGTENPRGPSLDQALVQLSHGRTITMADCVISSGAAWIVRRAPPRKAR